MTTQISVVIPVYNSESYLGRCLDALVAQDYPPERFEILVVDNNSTDGSRKILQGYDSARLLREPKQSSYAARNRGIREARGEIIAFLDPDCVPVSAWLSTIAAALEPPGPMIVLGKREFDAPTRGLRHLSNYDTVLAEYLYASDNPAIYFGYCNNMAVRRTVLDEQGGFHEIARGADTVLVQSAALAHGCEAIVHATDMAVVHLEVRSVGDFYRKRMHYGISNSHTRSLGTARPLSRRERLEVYTGTVRRHGYSPLQALELLMLLSLGLPFYSFGRWRGRLGRPALAVANELPADDQRNARLPSP